MDIWKSITGMLEVELTSAEPEQALATVNSAGIELLHLRRDGDLTCIFYVFRKDYRKLRELSEKRGETLRVLRGKGVFWTVQSSIKRPVLMAGILIMLTVMLFLPSRIFFVRVEGNITIPSRRILAAAEDCGIGFGASRREVRSEKMKNALLSAIPELQWAGINTAGCVATISVRERTDSENTIPENIVSNIVAERDGYILSGTVTQGNAVFQAGQTVKKGQVLISGYTDCGICLRATRAEGEIVAQTMREVDTILPQEYLQRGAVRDEKQKISLLLRKKRINLWKDSGISDSSCGRMYKEYYITLPGGFQLPIALCIETFVSYDMQTTVIPEDDVSVSLGAFAQHYVKTQMIAGEILDGEETVALENGVYRLSAMYICKEMIGREQQEQIGDTNGKSG